MGHGAATFQELLQADENNWVETFTTCPVLGFSKQGRYRPYTGIFEGHIFQQSSYFLLGKHRCGGKIYSIVCPQASNTQRDPH